MNLVCRVLCVTGFSSVANFRTAVTPKEWRTATVERRENTLTTEFYLMNLVYAALCSVSSPEATIHYSANSSHKHMIGVLVSYVGIDNDTAF